MCHFILLLPVISLPIFWLIPLNIAVPIYILIGLVTGLVYWLIIRSMKNPITTGAEVLIGSRAKVISRLSPNINNKYLVQIGGELWTAHSNNMLQPGEKVNVTSVHGIRLMVEQGNSGVAEKKAMTGRSNEWHCH